ncbi:MAG: proprotein convertase P-domain-containing protein, partial [Micromonosporaceae bacterium]
AARVRAAGATPRRVAHSRADLAAAAQAVGALAATGVTGWGVDVVGNVVEVRLAPGAPAPAGLAALGDVVRTAEGVAQRQQGGDVRGGDEWKPGTESSCSIGFSATGSGGSRHFVTAGHCTNDTNQAAYGKDGTQLGASNGSINGMEGDFGKVDVTAAGWNLSSTVYAYGTASDVKVTGSTEPTVGMSICRSGWKTGWRCGTVTQVNQTINYPNVSVGGQFVTNACSNAGDSGGAYVTGDKAVGIHSGGGNPCGQSNPNTNAQPVNEALTKWGLTLVTGTASPTPTQSPTASPTVSPTVSPTAPPTSSPPTSSPPPGTRTFSNETDYPIRDYQRTYSPITSGLSGQAATSVKLSVTISHTCAEDLGISLVAPDGTLYAVKYSGGYSCTVWSGAKAYTLNGVNEAAGGTWQLRVSDYGPGDVGTLQSWTVTL